MTVPELGVVMVWADIQGAVMAVCSFFDYFCCMETSVRTPPPGIFSAEGPWPAAGFVFRVLFKFFGGDCAEGAGGL